MPDDVWPAVVFTLVTLLDDPVAAEVAAEAVEPVATAWDLAARVGLADQRLHAAAQRCVAAVADRAPAELSESMARLVQNVDDGRSPADDFADRAVRHGIGPRPCCNWRGTACDRPRGRWPATSTRARERTLRLVDFDDAELHRQYNPLMSPLVWDLAHIGQQEELWLLRDGNPDRPGMLPPNIEGLYDAFVHSRASRVDLPLLSPARAAFLLRTVRAERSTLWTRCPTTTTRSRSASAWSSATRTSTTRPCCRRSTCARARRCWARGAPLPARSRRCGRNVGAGARAASSSSGVDAADEPLSLDNERPAHVVDVPPFRIGRVPVTNGEWRSSSTTAATRQQRWWSARGWAHREQAGLTAPQFWNADGSRTRFGHVEEIPGRRTGAARHLLRGRGVRGVGGCAAAHRGGMGEGLRLGSGGRCAAPLPVGRRRNPRPGCANLGGDALRPAPVGAYPAGASAYGVEQMLGDVWEWTTSPLRPWPGFTPMIYERYSEPFFDGDYRVLRGGSWAVAADILRPSFRNWDHPIRRQIFSGVRLAWDV